MSTVFSPCQGIVTPLKKLGDGKYDTGELAVVVTNSDNYSDMKVLGKGMLMKSKPMIEMV